MQLRVNPILFAAFLVLSPSTRLKADVKNISLGVNEAICPACANRLNACLVRIDGILKTKIRTGGGIYLDVRIKPNSWISPARMQEAIEKIGFIVRPADVRLTVTGKVVKEGDHLTLLLDDVKSQQLSFLLMPYHLMPSHEKKRTADPPQDDPSSEWAKQIGQTVEVEGYWRDAKKGESLQTLLVTRFTPGTP